MADEIPILTDSKLEELRAALLEGRSVGLSPNGELYLSEPDHDPIDQQELAFVEDRLGELRDMLRQGWGFSIKPDGSILGSGDRHQYQKYLASPDGTVDEQDAILVRGALEAGQSAEIHPDGTVVLAREPVRDEPIDPKAPERFDAELTSGRLAERMKDGQALRIEGVDGGTMVYAASDEVREPSPPITWPDNRREPSDDAPDDSSDDAGSGDEPGPGGRDEGQGQQGEPETEAPEPAPEDQDDPARTVAERGRDLHEASHGKWGEVVRHRAERGELDRHRRFTQQRRDAELEAAKDHREEAERLREVAAEFDKKAERLAAASNHRGAEEARESADARRAAATHEDRQAQHAEGVARELQEEADALTERIEVAERAMEAALQEYQSMVKEADDLDDRAREMSEEQEREDVPPDGPKEEQEREDVPPDGPKEEQEREDLPTEGAPIVVETTPGEVRLAGEDFLRTAVGSRGQRMEETGATEAGWRPTEPTGGGVIDPAQASSEFVAWAARSAGTDLPSDAFAQYRELQQSGHVEVGEALDYPGALVFEFRGIADPTAIGPDDVLPTPHVAISLGDGRVIEVGDDGRIRIAEAGDRFTHAAVVPDFEGITLDIIDLDRDGLYDADEIRRGTDRFSADTDRDFLTDGQEVDAGLDPLKKDSDGDGVPDWQELRDAEVVPAIDGDGLEPSDDADAASEDLVGDLTEQTPALAVDGAQPTPSESDPFLPEEHEFDMAEDVLPEIAEPVDALAADPAPVAPPPEPEPEPPASPDVFDDGAVDEGP